MSRFGCGSFGKFEIILRFDLVERRLRRIRQRHLVGEFKYIANRQGRPYFRGGCRFIEAGQQRVDVVLAVGRSRLRRRGRWRDGRRRGLERGCCHLCRGGLRHWDGRWRNGIHHGLGCRRRCGGFFRLRGCRAGRPFSGSRLCFVVGNDAPDRRQNLLHRGLLDLCRLRHLRPHIINAPRS